MSEPRYAYAVCGSRSGLWLHDPRFTCHIPGVTLRQAVFPSATEAEAAAKAAWEELPADHRDDHGPLVVLPLPLDGGAYPAMEQGHFRLVTTEGGSDGGDAEDSGGLFTSSDVARFCEGDLKSIHNWANKGEIRHFRTPGRHLRFRRVDVIDFLRRYGYPIPAVLRGKL